MSALMYEELLGPGAGTYGCLFCRSGKEQKIIRELVQIAPEVDAISPMKVRIRRSRGCSREELVTLFPGYVFFRAAEGAPDMSRFVRLEDVLRLLTYTDGEWRLAGSDEAIARMFFGGDGIVGLSKAYYEGDRIRVTEGTLKRYEDSITRVNHRARTAEVKVDFHGKILTMWLGFELIEPAKDEIE